MGNISSTHTDNRKKDTLILGEDLIDKLDDTKITAKAKYSVKIAQEKMYLILS